jgi:hypothetical protein
MNEGRNDSQNVCLIPKIKNNSDEIENIFTQNYLVCLPIAFLAFWGARG